MGYKYKPKKDVHFANLPIQYQLIIGQMALDNIPFPVQRFYMSVIDDLRDRYMTIREMARKTNYSERAVGYYMKQLQVYGYAHRMNYRCWVLTSEDGYILRDDNIFGKIAREKGCHI